MNNLTVQNSNSKALIYVIFLLGILALSFTAPWTKLANFEPATNAILRCSIGALALIPFAFMEAKKMGKLNSTGVWLSIAAGFFLGIDFTAWNYSIYYVGSGIASILLNIQVIILPALAYFVDKEKIPFSYYFIAPTLLLGVILSGGSLDPYLLGKAIVNEGPKQINGVDIAMLGTILGLTSGCCYGIYLFASRRAAKVNAGQTVQPIFISTVAQLIAPTLFIILFSSHGFELHHGVLDANGKLPNNPETTWGADINITNWLWMIVLGVLGQAMAWTFAQYGSVRLNPTLGAGLLLLSPVSTVAIIAPLMFGEGLSMLQVLGVVIALAAVGYQNKVWQGIWKKITRQH